MTCSIAAEPNRRNFRVWNGHGYVTTLPMAIPDTDISADRQMTLLWRYSSWSLVHDCVTVRSAKNRHLQTARTLHKPMNIEHPRRLWPDWARDLQVGSGRQCNQSRAKFLKIVPKYTASEKWPFPFITFIALTTAPYARRESLWWRHSRTRSHYAIEKPCRPSLAYKLLNEQFTSTKTQNTILID